MIEKELDRLLSVELLSKRHKIAKASCLIEACRYAVLGGGKRFRPQLVLATASLYQIPLKKALLPACALELIHTYSLIHDDLPCMDNDDFRRGKPSLHKVYGESSALLAGNFLLTYAYEILATAPSLSSKQRVDLILTVSNAIGLNGLLGGQELDLMLTGEQVDTATLEDLYQRKTVCLISASIEFGLIIAGVSDRKPLRNVGEKIGLLFQLLDDIQDEDDLIAQRPNACRVWGRHKSYEKAHLLYRSIEEELHPWPNSQLMDCVKRLFESCKELSFLI